MRSNFQIYVKLLLSEFRMETWVAVFMVEFLLLFLLAWIFLCLLRNGIEKTPMGKSEASFAIESSFNLKLRSIISIKLNTGFESLTYRILVFILMIFGFVILTWGAR